jgi:hypothetical protein
MILLIEYCVQWHFVRLIAGLSPQLEEITARLAFGEARRLPAGKQLHSVRSTTQNARSQLIDDIGIE